MDPACFLRVLICARAASVSWRMMVTSLLHPSVTRKMLFSMRASRYSKGSAMVRTESEICQMGKRTGENVQTPSSGAADCRETRRAH